MTRSFTRLHLRALVALLLAILFAQALPSQAIPLDRGRGPVFSAATVEVTLPPREDEAGNVCTLGAPCRELALDSETPILSPRSATESDRTPVWPDNRQRGPPLRPPPRSLASPREPPFLA